MGTSSGGHPPFVLPERVCGGQACFEARDVQHTALRIALRQLQPAGLGHTQAMPAHQEQEAPGAGRIADAAVATSCPWQRGTHTGKVFVGSIPPPGGIAQQF